MLRVLGIGLIALVLLAGGYLVGTRLHNHRSDERRTSIDGSTAIRTAIRPEP